MANETNTLSQIYELKSLGFKQLTNEFETINKQLLDIAKNKQAAGKGGNQLIDPAAINKLMAQLDDLKASAGNVNTAADTMGGRLAELTKLYQDATATAQAYSTELGVNSEKYKEATVQADLYRQQLLAIDDLIQRGAALPVGTGPAPVAPPTPSAPTTPQQTPEQVQQLTAAYAEEGAAVDAASAAFQELTAAQLNAEIPLQELTGTLTSNVALFNLNKTAIADIRAEMKSLSNNTSDAGKQTGAYQARMAQLTAEERRLIIANRDLNQTINGQTQYLQATAGSVDQLRAKLIIFRNYYDSLSEDIRASPLGQGIQTQIQGVTAQISKLEQGTARFQRNVGNYASALYGYLRTAANILPGIGIAGIFGLAYEGIQKLTQGIIESLSNIGSSVDSFKLKQKDLTAAFASADYTKAVENVNLLRINIDLAKQGFLDQDEVLNQYNTTIGKVTGQVTSLDAAQAALANNSDKYIKATLYQAAANISLQESAKLLNEAEQLRIKDLREFLTTTNSIVDALSGLADADAIGVDKSKNAADLRLEQEKRNQAAAIKIKEDGAKAELKIATDFQTRAAKIASSNGFDLFGGKKDALGELKKDLDSTIKTIATVENSMAALGIKENAQLDALVKHRNELKSKIKDIEGSTAGSGNKGGDRLGAANTNALNLIDAQLKTEISNENTRVNELRKSHELSYDEERQYLENIKTINERYFKLKYDAIKGNNTKEIQERAALREQITDLEAKTAQQINAINKKQFDDRMIQLKTEHDEEVRLAQQQFQTVQLDPSSTPTEKADAQLDLDRRLIAAQVSFNIAVDVQEKLLMQHSEKNARDRAIAIAQIEDQSRQDRIKAGEAVIADIQNEGDRQQLITKVNYGKLRAEILKNDKITESERRQQLQQLQKTENISLLTGEVQTLTKDVAAKKEQYKLGLGTDEAYLAAKSKLDKKAEDLQNAVTEQQDNIQKFLNKSIGDSGLTFGFLISQGFDLAKDAMNEYFDAEADRIAANRDDQTKLLDTQKDAAKKAAQARGASTAEQSKIDADYEKKKDAINKAAGQKLKKIKKAELAISYANEIAHIAEAAAANPLNGATFGGAGAAQLAILSGLADIRYLFQLAQINRQQFAYGGQVVPRRGGRFKGPSHSQGGINIMFRGTPANVEGDELGIIRTRNAPANRRYTITGTHTQIASKLNEIGGGNQFAAGARVQKYAFGGNVPGAGLSAPLYIPAQSTGYGAISGEALGEMRAQNALLVGYITATNNRIDKLSVGLDTDRVTTGLRDRQNQKQIGKL